MSTNQTTQSESPPIRVLIVEDSRVTRTYVQRVLSAASDLQVLEPAVDGADAVEKALTIEPDVILMDLHLPKLDGIAAIEMIMSEKACPIVVMSGQLTSRDTDYTFAALNAGAVDVISKPKGLDTELREGFARELISTLRLMSKVKVVTRRFSKSSLCELSDVIAHTTAPRPRNIEIVAIGASTGGPAATFEVLSRLSAPTPFAVAISQHIANGFEHGLCSWLRTTGHDVRIPVPGTPPQPGRIYLSPANASLVTGPKHLELVPTVGSEITPNIDRLFLSVARHYGARSTGVLLTGMGDDGVRGLRAMFDAGAWTLVQDADSAVIDSMPASAAAAGAAREILNPADIARRLTEIARPSGGKND